MGRNIWVLASSTFNHGRFRPTTGRIHRVPTSKSFRQPRAEKGLRGEFVWCPDRKKPITGKGSSFSRREYQSAATRSRLAEEKVAPCTVEASLLQPGCLPWWWRGRKNCKQICNRALSRKYLRISVLGPIWEHYFLTNFCYLSLFSIKTCFSVT